MTIVISKFGEAVRVKGSSSDPKAMQEAYQQALQLAEGRGSLNR